jgi:tetratricopeptide (TPR) repeat protein
MEEQLLHAESVRLRKDVEWALRRAIDPTDVLPMLHRLARTAAPGSEESVFAYRHLAELVAPRHPWRAALYARRALAHRPEDDRAWAVLALCQTLLGNYRFACKAYHRALVCAPKNPWYAHNLGHLLDVALGRAEAALEWLRTAYTGAPGNGEIAASLAHALARAGKLNEAKKVLVRAMRRGGSREHAALWKWLEKGAPAHGLAGSTPPGADDFDPDLAEGDDELGTEDEASSKGEVPRPPPRAKATRTPRGGLRVRLRNTEPRERRDVRGGGDRTETRKELEAALGRGLKNLPLDATQRARARALARDAMAVLEDRIAASVGREARESAASTSPPGSSASGGKAVNALQSLAAAIAYGIVYVDHVPLTQAEVAAPFRVSVARLRGRFGQLRAELALLPGDARYASASRT